MSVARGCFMVQPHQKLVLITVGHQQTNDTRPPLIMEVKKNLLPVKFNIIGAIGDITIAQMSAHNKVKN